MQRFLLAIAIVVGLGAVAAADTEARWTLGERGQPHAGMPFTLVLAIGGFDDSPAVEQPKLEIAGATVTPLGAQPRVQQMSMNINGQRSITKQVTWVLSYRIEAAAAGTLHVPTLTVAQGKLHATAAGAEIELDAVPTTDLMKVELQLPERPIFVGETVDAKLVLMVRAQPSNPQFTIPIASLDQFTVTAPPVVDRSKAIEITVGDKPMLLPYDQDRVDLGGQKWSRFSLHLFIAPRTSGKVQVAPASVVAGLPTGQPDVFGSYDQRLFRATDAAKAIDVKPLPETDRPPSFAGAVGGQFSISVGTSRSVVQLGEPVELAITVKSDQRLDTLALGKLAGDGELPKDKFTVSGDPPTGELSEDGKTKTFKVTALVIGPATEIPALTFSYFDPAKTSYQTIHSDPIALSVKSGGAVVGANDVVAMAPKAGAHTGNGAPAETDLALVGAELALSAPGDVDNQPLGGAVLAGLLAALYVGALGVFAVVTWQRRTRDQREEAAEVKTARKKVDTVLARADKEPARDTAGPLAGALRELARTVGRDLDDDGLLARLETESFSRTAKDEPLAAELRQRAKELAARWSREVGRVPVPKSAVVVMLLVAALAPASARADGSGTMAALNNGRAAYQDALGVSDASARKVSFTRAAAALGEAAHAAPGRPELLTDWGNAALGAGDVGTATLAYRRALALDPSNPRARRNLNWLRSRESDNLRPLTGGAADTLFFFHDWPRGRRLLIGALAFALAVMLVVPWAGRRRRGLAMLAIVPAIAWLALTISVFVEDRRSDDAVVMDAVVLRAADSSGAPAALTQPLPRGTEVTVVEKRDAWAKLRIAAGIVGWVPASAIQRVAAE